jgi:hypothetical protein
MIYKSEALNHLRVLYRSRSPKLREMAYNRLYELINILLPDKPAEAE